MLSKSEASGSNHLGQQDSRCLGLEFGLNTAATAVGTAVASSTSMDESGIGGIKMKANQGGLVAAYEAVMKRFMYRKA